MYCRYCGNKVDDNAYICVKCGVVLDNSQNIKIKKKNKKKSGTGVGILSIIFGIICFSSSLSCFFQDISKVGMYTEIYEKINYAIELTSISIMLTFISLVFSLLKKEKTSNKIGLSLTLISLFLIITEIMVVMIY